MRTRVGIGLLVGLYALWNLAAWSASEPQDSYDSYRYFLPLTDIQNPGVVVNAVFLLVQSREVITGFQVFTATIAWLLLALVTQRRLGYSAVSWIIAVLVLLFSMTEHVWSWHMLTYTESLTTTVLVLWLAALVWLAEFEGSAWKRLSPLTATTALLALTRPQLLMIVMPVLMIVGIWWFRRRGLILPGVVAFATTLPFAAFAAWRVWEVGQVPLYRFRYALNNLFEKDESFRPYALANAPRCDAVTNALGSTDPWSEVHALDKTMMGPCPETWLWFRSDHVLFTSWAREVPGQTLGEFVSTMPGVVLPSGSGQIVMPPAVSSLLLDPSRPWVWAVLYLTFGVLAAAASRVRIRVTPLAVLAWITIALACAAYLLLVWGSDGYDIERHVYPFLPMVAVAGVVLPATLPSRRQIRGDTPSAKC